MSSNHRSKANLGQTAALRVWEAISAEPSLGDFLAAVSKVILPIVPFDCIGIVALEHGRYRFFAGYNGGRSTEGQRAQDQAVLDMMGGDRRTQVATRPLAPYPPEVLATRAIGDLAGGCVRMP